ncbi:HTH_Tnp_Tc3_2 domain-containing protein [Trichonephila clavipes]|nr:HTH_Tnp_Tc3_2 domain-containing protein [Trichonephila clavipes]
MPRVRSRNVHQHISDFDKGRIVAYRNCGLSYRSIAARVGRDPMTISRIWTRWVQDGNTELRAGSQRSRRPWLRLSLTLHHRQERLQWYDQRRTWCPNGETSFFQVNLDSVYSIMIIRVPWHRGEYTLAACIRHRYTGPSPGMMV